MPWLIVSCPAFESFTIFRKSDTHLVTCGPPSAYLDPYHDPEDEPVAPVLPPSFFAFDQQQLSREQLKSEHPISL